MYIYIPTSQFDVLIRNRIIKKLIITKLVLELRTKILHIATPRFMHMILMFYYFIFIITVKFFLNDCRHRENNPITTTENYDSLNLYKSDTVTQET